MSAARPFPLTAPGPSARCTLTHRPRRPSRHESLETGRAEEQCSTYLLDGCLASAPDFAVAGIEVWAVADDPPAPEEDAAREGALSEAHKETRAFLALAGREMRSDNVAPPPREEEEKQDDA